MNRIARTLGRLTQLCAVHLVALAAPAIAAEGYVTGTIAAAVTVDQEAASLVPREISERGVIRFSAYINSPYTMIDDNTALYGAAIDLGAAIATKLGVAAEIDDVASVAASKVAVDSGRYDVGLGPFLDSVSAEADFNIINWIRVTPGFVFRAGDDYTDPLDFCGKSLSIVSGSVPVEQNMLRLRSACAEAGLEEQVVSAFGDQNSMLIAVLSGRNDGAVLSSASALYIAQRQAGRLDAFSVETDLFGVGTHSGLGIPKANMALAEAVLAAMNSLLASGDYRGIFAEYGLDDLTVDAMSLNAASAASD